jgi:hydrogenase-4 component B
MILLACAAFVLLLGATLSLVVPGNRARVLVSLGAQAIASAATLAAVVPVLAGAAPLTAQTAWSYPVGSVAFQVDALSGFFLAWSLPMTFLGSLYAAGYLKADLDSERNAGPHFALLDVLCVSYLMIYSAQDTMVFLLGWEIAAVCAWLLVIWSYRSQKIRFAGFNYLVSTHIGLFFLAAALMTLHAQTGSMDFTAFGSALSRPGTLRNVTFLVLGVAFALKSAFFPFHTWLPRAHAAAPAHVSALMSGVIHKAGLFGFLRFTMLLGEPEPWMGWTILAFGATSAIFGALFTTTQRDLKRLLGYSSTENVGVAAMGFGVGYLGMSWHRPELVALGFGGGLLHLFNHALFKCLLFYGAGAVHRATHTVDLERLGGLAKRMPKTAVLFGIGALAIAGLPPFNGFVSELAIYTALFRSGTRGNEAAALVAFAACLAFTGSIGAFAVVRAFGIAFLGTPRDPSVVHENAEPPWTMWVPMAAHAVGIVVVGLIPVAGLAVAAPPAAQFGELDALTGAIAAAATANRVVALSLAVPLALGWLAGRRAPVHVTWGCGYPVPTPKMQYTASSFAAPFARLFEPWIPPMVRRALPHGFFPSGPGELATHHPDPIERRMFEAIGQGEELVAGAFGRFAADSRLVFAVGLLTLVVLALLVTGRP